MFFLIQIIIKADGSISKGTTDFATMHDTMVQFHVAMASAMQKDDIKKATCLIINENGLQQKVEVYEVAQPVEEEPVEITAEEAEIVE